MVRSPCNTDGWAGTRHRSRSMSRPEKRRPRSRSPSRSSHRVRVTEDTREEDRYRWRDRDEKLERVTLREAASREEHGGREAARSYPPGGDRESDRRSGRHHRHHHHRGDRPHRHRHDAATREWISQKELPFSARQLSRSDLVVFRPLFAHYLDLQKSLDINSLDETELRGRWKSFMGKWNRGELAEGWYDPEVFQRAARDYQDSSSHKPDRLSSPPPASVVSFSKDKGAADDDDDDDYGPPPPPPQIDHLTPPMATLSSSASASRIRTQALAPGPTIPTQADLSLRDEALEAARESELTTLRLARRAHRREQKALLDETLPPRADAGTRERRLEKRKEVNEKMRGFREKSPVGEVPEGELFGGGATAEEEYRAIIRAREEKRKERVSRREEAERARLAEREERVRGYREREAKVVEGLRELARQRFGI